MIFTPFMIWMALKYFFLIEGWLLSWIIEQRVKLLNDICALDQTSKLAPIELIDEVAEGVVLFLLIIWLMHGKLKLAGHFAHEKKVDMDIIVRLFQFILNSDYLK